MSPLSSCQPAVPPLPHTQSAKVELGGLGCGARPCAGRGGVRKGTVPAAGLGLRRGVRVPLPISPRPYPKSQHPGITHRAGRPAPERSPPYPAPPHPRPREAGKPGLEPKPEFEEGSAGPALSSRSSSPLDGGCAFPSPRAFLLLALSCSPQTEQVRGAPGFILPQDNTSFHSLYPTDPGGSPQKP